MTATPGQLKSTLARVFAYPESAIDYPWRALREAGLVTKGGRGRSAAKVTARDAARLVIAVAGSVPSSEVVASARRYGALAGDWSIQPNFSVPDWLSVSSTLEDLLTAMIAAAGDGRFQAFTNEMRSPSDENPLAPGHCFVEISLLGPFPQASVRVAATHGQGMAVFSEWPSDVDQIRDYKFMDADLGGLDTSRRFNDGTIKILGELIGSPE
ncbi:MAG: hypothetical protein ACK5U9_04745 [Brevundimonas sp.]|uniref:hypothetical protein n=1 Tax=Brevundimonas sp. TaxID=1871086 RepID=UPI003918ECB8